VTSPDCGLVLVFRGAAAGAGPVEARRASERIKVSQPGIVSYHSFSARPYYDPDNVSFGPLTGFDEHVIDPGGGFGWHAHRGVDIVTWVLEGSLTHRDSLGNEHELYVGALAHLAAGFGVRHEERNAGTGRVRFVQATLLSEPRPPRYAVLDGPTQIGSVLVRTVQRRHELIELGQGELLHLLVGRARLSVEPIGELTPGDTLRAVGPASLHLSS
jgi:mannose-6-phosphate isomerase-like protein (cupin superfamily)